MLKNIDDFLRSGHIFTKYEHELQTNYLLVNILLVVLVIFSFLWAIFSFFSHDFDYLIIYALSAILASISLLVARVVHKNKYYIPAYVINLGFFALILSGYYYKSDIHPLAGWAIIQIFISLLILNIWFAIGLSMAYIFSILIISIFSKTDMVYTYFLTVSIPIFVAMAMVYLLHKRIFTSMLLLDKLNVSLENEVDLRTEEIKKEKEKFYYQAHYDYLTNLPNRNHLFSKIDTYMHEYQSTQEKFAVIFIDLDRFKKVNDSLGHHMGDRVLVKVKDRIINHFDTTIFFARHGGDEFVLLCQYTSIEEIFKIVEKIIYLIQKPIILDNRKLHISCTAGISCYPENGGTSAELIQNADTAMFESKKVARASYKLYTNEMTDKVSRMVKLESDVYRALENDEFELFYQPQMDIYNNKIVSMEALIRWSTHENTLMLPEQFIPMAEEFDLIIGIDYYVLKKVMIQLVEWRKNNLFQGKVSVNVSTSLFIEKDFIHTLSSLLLETKCKAEWLEIEITEGVVISDIDKTINILKQLRQIHISVALDDFGTGYSSLSYLQKLPLDKIKIDKSFICDLSDNQVNQSIIRAMLDIAKSKKLMIVAEGVERQEELDFLLSCGCQSVQGYFYYRPLPIRKIERVLSEALK